MARRRSISTQRCGKSYCSGSSTTALGHALGSNGITKSLAKVGLQRLGKRLGSSLLRHSYLSHKYSKTSEEKEKDADLMMHSVAMQDGYIKT